MPGAAYYSVTKPVPGTTLDRGHPLARNLRFAPIFNEGSGRYVRDHAGGKSLLFGAGTWVRTRWGSAINFPGTASQGASGSGLLLNGRPWTVSVRYLVDLDQEHYFWDLGQTGTDNEMHLRDGFAADRINVNLYSDDHQIETDKGLGVWHQITITQQPDTLISVYQNGVLKGTSDAAGNFSGNAGTWYLGGRSIGGSDEFIGVIEHFMLWDRALSVPEIASHAAAPYQMFDPPMWRRIFSGVSAPPPQFARPTSDTSVGTWTTDTGATTNLYQAIDESTASDSDYIHSPADP